MGVMDRKELVVGGIYSGDRRSEVMVMATTGWKKHPTYREFDEVPGARGVAVAVKKVSFYGVETWEPDVIQLSNLFPRRYP